MKNLIISLFLVNLLLVCGCSNYKLAGTAQPLPFKTIKVSPVENISYAPQAANLLTSAISTSLMQVAGLKLANEAQATLKTQIIDYDKVPVATQSDDTALAAAYRLKAVAVCTLTKTNGEIIFKDRKVRAEVNVYTNGTDFISEEYQNMPILMRELGKNIKNTVIGIW